MILYINNEHCENIEQLKNYFINELNNQNVIDDILDYGRSGDIAEWLREHGEEQYADKIDSIDNNLGDTDYIKELASILTETAADIEKIKFDKCFQIKDATIEENDEFATLTLSINILYAANEHYEIKVSTNRGTKGDIINPSDYKEDSVIQKTFKFNKRAGKKNLEDITVEIEGQKVDVKFEGGIGCTDVNNNNKTTDNLINGHEYVDLGLPSGLKWATCNVGANKPEDYGGYYSWGNSKYSVKKEWGESWKLPSKQDFQELISECTWEWTSQNSVNGYKVIGTNGNSIFLPAAGFRCGSSLYNAGSYGYYWGSTPYEGDGSYAYNLFFYSGGHGMDYSNRDYGQSVRPVTE